MTELSVQDAFGVKGLELISSNLAEDPTRPLQGADLEVKWEGQAGKSLPIFNKQVKLTTSAGAVISANLHKPDAQITDPFGGKATAPSAYRWAEFNVEGALEASGSGEASSGPWRLSASAVSTAKLHYRHLILLPTSETVGSALQRVVLGARRPNDFIKSGLAPGEFCYYSGRFHFGLDAKLSAGKKFEYKRAVDLFDGFSKEIQASAEATVEATLGLALFEALELTVGRGIEVPANRLRLRLARTRQRGLTLGARAAVTVRQNLGSFLAATLDHILGLEPAADLISALRKVAQISAQTPAELEEKISAAATDDVVGWLFGRLSLDQASLESFKKQIDKFVETYDKLDTRVSSLWLDILDHVGVEAQLQGILQNVANFKNLTGKNLIAKIVNDLGSAQSRGLIDMLELLTGDSIETLLSKPLGALDQGIGKAVKVAEDSLVLLTTGFPQKITDIIRAYAQETGIAGFVDWLRKHEVDANALKAAAEKPVRKVVSRLFHKAWEQISDGEVEKLLRFGRDVKQELGKLDEWKKRLTNDLEKIDKEIGATLSIEISRQFFQEAILDADLEQSLWKDTAKELSSGNIPMLLQRICGEAQEDSEDGEEVAVVRECSLLSRRTRTSSWLATFKALGLEWFTGGSTFRLVESFERLENGARKVTVRGRSERAVRQTREGWRSAAELTINGVGGSFGGDVVRSEPSVLTLTVGMEDDKTQDEERDAIDALFAKLGLVSASNTTARDFTGGNSQVRMGLELRCEPQLAALIPVLSDALAWDTDLLQAAESLFLDHLVSTSQSASFQGFRAGDILAKVLTDPKVLTALKNGTADETFFKNVSLKVGAKPVSLSTAGATPVLSPPARALPQLARLLGTAGRRAAKVQKSFAALVPNHSRAADYEDLAVAFTTLHSKLRLPSYSENPMLGFWLIFGRLQSAANLVVTGAATVECRQADTEPWSGKAIWVR